jgi:hypothetical protein
MPDRVRQGRTTQRQKQLFKNFKKPKKLFPFTGSAAGYPIPANFPNLKLAPNWAEKGMGWGVSATLAPPKVNISLPGPKNWAIF